MVSIPMRTRRNIAIGFRTNRYLNALQRLVYGAIHRLRRRRPDIGTDDWGFEHVIRHEEELTRVMGRPRAAVLRKVTDQLDELCRAFIARSPFVIVASHDAQGNLDVSPKGDPAGFVLVLDDRTLAIPERPGNLRADTFRNLLTLREPKVAILFMIPGKSETLRVCGRALIVRDRALREKMAVNGKVPEVALVVRIDEAFFHCAMSMVRSQLWNPQSWGPVTDLPSLADAMVKHGALKESVDQMAGIIQHDQDTRLY